MTRPSWRIFYDDGATFDSRQGEPHQAPTRGFVCAVGYDERGERYIMHGWDFYRWDRDARQWWGMDLFGLMDALHEGRVYAFKEGRTVTRSEFERLMDTAHRDPDFPQG